MKYLLLPIAAATDWTVLQFAAEPKKENKVALGERLKKSLVDLKKLVENRECPPFVSSAIHSAETFANGIDRVKLPMFSFSKDNGIYPFAVEAQVKLNQALLSSIACKTPSNPATELSNSINLLETWLDSRRNRGLLSSFFQSVTYADVQSNLESAIKAFSTSMSDATKAPASTASAPPVKAPAPPVAKANPVVQPVTPSSPVAAAVASATSVPSSVAPSPDVKEVDKAAPSQVTPVTPTIPAQPPAAPKDEDTDGVGAEAPVKDADATDATNVDPNATEVAEDASEVTTRKEKVHKIPEDRLKVIEANKEAKAQAAAEKKVQKDENAKNSFLGSIFGFSQNSGALAAQNQALRDAQAQLKNAKGELKKAQKALKKKKGETSAEQQAVKNAEAAVAEKTSAVAAKTAELAAAKENAKKDENLTEKKPSFFQRIFGTSALKKAQNELKQATAAATKAQAKLDKANAALEKKGTPKEQKAVDAAQAAFDKAEARKAAAETRLADTEKKIAEKAAEKVEE